MKPVSTTKKNFFYLSLKKIFSGRDELPQHTALVLKQGRHERVMENGCVGQPSPDTTPWTLGSTPLLPQTTPPHSLFDIHDKDKKHQYHYSLLLAMSMTMRQYWDENTFLYLRLVVRVLQSDVIEMFSMSAAGSFLQRKECAPHALLFTVKMTFRTLTQPSNAHWGLHATTMVV